MLLDLWERAGLIVPGLIGPDVYRELAKEVGAENARRVAEELKDKKTGILPKPPKKGEKT